ncbi:GDSL-type esterase/lipase family protein [Actinoplanes sp. M2I2]|uniref:GDSL-type esterase/lipase family protein n=1 Tax=Actinoplanes sp. M2I2 TaxID=1734444 RepID=UPI0020224E98|nr:GDSL-type esterase/lipase family protein [Actinoplanes sp. M2I2]
MNKWVKSATVVSAAVVVLVVAAIVWVRRDSGSEGNETAKAVSFGPIGAGASPDPSKDAWTGTWATAMQDGRGKGFQRETVRQVIRASIGGDAVRVKLSNQFGKEPLTVSAVHLAKHVGEGKVDPSTNGRVTFGGKDSVTIKAGGTAVSDPVAFRLPAGGDLAISAYVPQRVGSVTQHESANRDNYAAPGDQTTKDSMSGGRSFYNYSFLAGVDVQNPASEGAVVALGASITDGYDSTWNDYRSWSDLLARRLNDGGRAVGVLNAGISGNSLLQNGVGQSGLNRLQRDVLGQAGVKWVIVADLGINDLGGADASTGGRLVTGLRQLIQRSHDADVKVLCTTLAPYAGSESWSKVGESGRKVFNTFVRSKGSGCDAVVDFDAATRDPADPSRWNSRFDQGDHLHPNNAGMEALATAIDLKPFA